jgi:hypothetical protein
MTATAAASVTTTGTLTVGKTEQMTATAAASVTTTGTLTVGKTEQMTATAAASVTTTGTLTMGKTEQMTATAAASVTTSATLTHIQFLSQPKGVTISTRMDVKRGTAGDAWSGSLVGDFQSRHLAFQAFEEDIDVRVSHAGFDFQDYYHVATTTPVKFPFSARAIQVRNHTPASAGDYQITFFD